MLPAPDRGGTAMPEVELSARAIEYEDTGGDGPVLVLLHAVAMNGSLWRNSATASRHDHRCVRLWLWLPIEGSAPDAIEN